MAWWYNVDGQIRFPTAEGPGAWRKAQIRSWKGKGKVTVDMVLGWTGRETLVDGSASPDFLESYFFDAIADGAVLSLRGFIHRDDAEAIEALLETAAELKAKGDVRLDHVLDSNSGLLIKVANGRTTVREGDVKLPNDVREAIERESKARARKLAGGSEKKKAATPKKKATAKKKAAAPKTKATPKTKAATPRAKTRKRM